MSFLEYLDDVQRHMGLNKAGMLELLVYSLATRDSSHWDKDISEFEVQLLVEFIAILLEVCYSH